MKKVALLLSFATTVVLLTSGVARAELVVGTDGPDNLVGTNSNDHLTGAGGEDTLMGRAGNDVYHFNNGFGFDTLTETKKVGKKPGGTDTLSFSRYGGFLGITLIPEWGESNNFVQTTTSSTLMLGTSPVENVVGGSNDDVITGGSVANNFSGGPGGDDLLEDYGGCDLSCAGPTALASSNDTYKGFTSGTGFDEVHDYGGKGDRLDLRPLESSDVYFDAFDADSDGSEDSVEIVIDDFTEVDVYGYFSPVHPGQQNGRIEQIIFSNETITSASVASML